jgi:hypothetical protein
MGWLVFLVVALLVGILILGALRGWWAALIFRGRG